jgi:hypothetical protein
MFFHSLLDGFGIVRFLGGTEIALDISLPGIF